MLANVETKLTLGFGAVHDALRTVRHAICKEETRYYLNGVYMHHVDGNLCFVATDGHRLALAKIPVEASDVPAVILPSDFVAAVLKATAKPRDAWRTIVLNVAARRVVATTEMDSDHPIECTPVDGTFPDYARVFPTDEPQAIVFMSRDNAFPAFSALSDFYAAASKDKSRSVRLRFADDYIEASCKPAGCDNFSAVTRVSIYWQGGEPKIPCGDVGFNARYVADIINAADDGACVRSIKLTYRGPCAPAEFGLAGDASKVFLLMPVRI